MDKVKYYYTVSGGDIYDDQFVKTHRALGALRDIAVDAACDYQPRHSGWKDGQEREITLYNLHKNNLGTFVVTLDMRPTFSARKK